MREIEGLAIAAWVVGSLLWAEVVRDIYHAICHRIPALYRWHGWHHRVFRKDLTPLNDTIYRQAQWRHDLPESGVMLVMGLGLWGVALQLSSVGHWGAIAGILYTGTFIFGALVRGWGFEWAHELTDITHLPGPFPSPPSHWFVNRQYHWRHHFDNQDAYFCGALTFVDRLMGTALSLKGKTIAVTGASGTLGRALLLHLRQAGAKPVALTSSTETVSITLNGEAVTIPTVRWRIGNETELAQLFEKVDILVLNHGVNVHGERTAEAIERSYQVNAFSGLRLMELFLATVRTNKDIACKEVWVNTSEAEVSPAVSPLYELSKRAMGDWVTLRRLDAPCIIRKLILGPFKSNLNPIGVMSADSVAKRVVKGAQRDDRNIIVTINPLTFIAFPIKEFFVGLYFRFFTRGASVRTQEETS
ncbi:MAG: bifunctional sterol desaturase/short chain dehydrogenase [Cyanobacteriota bacterium]|nr:bifunctional sterol desaturase/short chain dehydrogenase [Cyanobacteriota bacterium]